MDNHSVCIVTLLRALPLKYRSKIDWNWTADFDDTYRQYLSAGKKVIVATPHWRPDVSKLVFVVWSRRCVYLSITNYGRDSIAHSDGRQNIRSRREWLFAHCSRFQRALQEESTTKVSIIRQVTIADWCTSVQTNDNINGAAAMFEWLLAAASVSWTAAGGSESSSRETSTLEMRSKTTILPTRSTIKNTISSHFCRWYARTDMFDCKFSVLIQFRPTPGQVLYQQFKFFLNLYFLIMALSQFVPEIRYLFALLDHSIAFNSLHPRLTFAQNRVFVHLLGAFVFCTLRHHYSGRDRRFQEGPAWQGSQQLPLQKADPWGLCVCSELQDQNWWPHRCRQRWEHEYLQKLRRKLTCEEHVFRWKSACWHGIASND